MFFYSFLNSAEVLIMICVGGVVVLMLTTVAHGTMRVN